MSGYCTENLDLMISLEWFPGNWEKLIVVNCSSITADVAVCSWVLQLFFLVDLNLETCPFAGPKVCHSTVKLRISLHIQMHIVTSMPDVCVWNKWTTKEKNQHIITHAPCCFPDCRSAVWTGKVLGFSQIFQDQEPAHWPKAAGTPLPVQEPGGLQGDGECGSARLHVCVSEHFKFNINKINPLLCNWKGSGSKNPAELKYRN